MHIATLEMLEQAKFAPEQARLLLEIWEKQEARHRAEHAALAERLVPREELKARQEILATKEDVHKLKDELKQDIHKLKDELKQDVLSTKQDIHKVKDELRQDIFRLMQWMIGLGVAQAGFTLALFKVFSPN